MAEEKNIKKEDVLRSIIEYLNANGPSYVSEIKQYIIDKHKLQNIDDSTISKDRLRNLMTIAIKYGHEIGILQEDSSWTRGLKKMLALTTKNLATNNIEKEFFHPFRFSRPLDDFTQKGVNDDITTEFIYLLFTMFDKKQLLSIEKSLIKEGISFCITRTIPHTDILAKLPDNGDYYIAISASCLSAIDLEQERLGHFKLDLRQEQGQFYATIKDLGSTNGTEVELLDRDEIFYQGRLHLGDRYKTETISDQENLITSKKMKQDFTIRVNGRNSFFRLYVFNLKQ